MKNSVNLFVSIAIVLLTGSIVGCGRWNNMNIETESPDLVLFRSAIPSSGSTIEADATITVTFDGTPENVSVSQGEAKIAGSNVVELSGPYTLGELKLTLTWADGQNRTLTYTVESDTVIENGNTDETDNFGPTNGDKDTENETKEPDPPDPVLFQSASPSSGSIIKANTTITVTFNDKPEDVSVSQGAVEISGSNAVELSGPYTLGELELKLTWADGGNQTLTYTVEGSRNGRLDIGDEVIAQNTVDEVNNIRGLRIRTGPGLNSKILGRVHDNATGIVIDGSVDADGYTWWKVRWNPGNLDCEEDPCEGWSAEFVNGDFVLAEN